MPRHASFVPLAGLLLALALASPGREARAEQCAPREIVQLAAPKTGARVSPSVRFRLYLGKGCSPIPEGLPSQFRILDSRDRVIPHRRALWAGYTELIPSSKLAAGVYRLQWRHAVNAKQRGPWKVLTTVTVVGAADGAPPRFDGAPPRASSRARRGYVALSPCQVRRGWRVERSIELAAARDGSQAPLLYSVLQWQPKKGKRTLKVVYASHHARGAGSPLTLRWTTDYGFDQTFELRVCARDLSGNHACSAPIALRTAKNPTHAWYRNLWPWRR